MTRAAFRGVGAVPHKNPVAAPVSAPLLEEGHDLPGAAVLVRMESCGEGDALALGGQGDRGEGRDFIPVLGIAQNRRLSSRGPGPAPAGDQPEPALVEEGQRGPKPFAVFYRRPALPLPLGDGWFVPLLGPLLRLWATPPHPGP